MRVLTWHVHGSYLWYLSHVPVTWLLPVRPGRSDGYGGRGETFDWPDNVLEVPESLDVDPTDNSDEFSVYVSAQSGGGGGGGGELPITGMQVGVIGGVGLAVVIAGVVLLLVGRRRRMVLVAPRDETWTA